MSTKTNILLTAFVIVALFPFNAFTQGSGPSVGATQALFQKGEPFAQDITITAYYSPLPDQCCYVRGSFVADVELNGEGHHSADGTAVYAGMAAAPPTYPFGTRITLPGIGTVTVHDRGGAIQEWKDSHRIDLWVGSGEEGLARALAFGVQRVHATVYPKSAQQPAESLVLTSLPSPPEKLRPYLSDGTTLLDMHPAVGDRTTSVQFLQERLEALGYFHDVKSGFFGPATRASLNSFIKDMALTEPDDSLTERTASVLEGAYLRREAEDPITDVISAGSSATRIAGAQRTLRFLGFYHGRTNGIYDAGFKAAVLAFQKEQGIVASDSAPGAGRIGPQTRTRIVLLWRRKHAGRLAGRLLAMRKIDQLVTKRGDDLRKFLGKGDHGNDVRALQNFLVTKKFLAKDGVTGTFGDRTEQALIAYQKAAGIIANDADPGAGYAGPATLAHYSRDLRSALLKIVREKGWGAI